MDFHEERGLAGAGGLDECLTLFDRLVPGLGEDRLDLLPFGRVHGTSSVRSGHMTRLLRRCGLSARGDTILPSALRRISFPHSPIRPLATAEA